ncbi:Na(+)-translocating NADH-quinone reductase subunit A [Roseivivax sediminis]|uniref:Na+-transporting NADH:ubiquinone oxidoreductase subunit A n=1 Tax=Roseivivax sediminis TaxID=936889 RepID=A0A1I1VB53_9RHOB|nr:Na(+)-translocating NADH-quinone reductase subunit A [Roseivivax sediminis]SFD80119.1 Na+-transporting NADH:ubiquinone oxidoreductase subunit A [Roseivivax sediminis]
MRFPWSGAGLNPVFASPPEEAGVSEVRTDEAAICPPVGQSLHVTPLLQEGDSVARGAAVACLRHHPEVRFAAPVAGRVARISLLPGRKLSEIVLYSDPGDAAERHDTSATNNDAGLRRLMQAAGFWPRLRRRPFGGMPAPEEVPFAVVVMATDTRPGAPDPRAAIEGQEDAFAHGLEALAHLSQGPVIVCAPSDAAEGWHLLSDQRARVVPRGPRHPQGAAGICVHRLCPAGLDAPVWDLHAEDVAALGALLATGVLPMTRLVRIGGAALRTARTVRTHPGADLRELTQRLVVPGPHELISGSALDGRPARWLAPRHRQITVLPTSRDVRPTHWLTAALRRPGLGTPAIPTAALNQAFGAALPAAPFVRALGAGDDESAMRLGLLSLLEEDVALADYVLGEGGRLSAQLGAMLDRIRTEFAA